MMGNKLLTVATQIMVMSIIIAAIILFIGFGILILLHICIVGRAIRRSQSSISRGERCSNEGNNGLSSDDLNKLPCYVFKNEEKVSSGSPITDCAVCLESFQKGEVCRLLPICRHSFHAHCVDFWLLTSPICPICRTRACKQKEGDKRLEDERVGFELGGSTAVVIRFPKETMDVPDIFSLSEHSAVQKHIW